MPVFHLTLISLALVLRAFFLHKKCTDEKNALFSSSSSFANLVIYTENNFCLVSKSLPAMYLFHLVSQFLDL